jgi:hypothetical protein
MPQGSLLVTLVFRPCRRENKMERLGSQQPAGSALSPFPWLCSSNRHQEIPEQQVWKFVVYVHARYIVCIIPYLW